MNKHKLKAIVFSGCVLGILLIIMLTYRDANKMPRRIVFITKSTNSQFVFWETVRMGAELAAKEEGINLECVGPLQEKDIQVQIELMEKAIQERVDIIMLAAAHSEKLATLVKTAVDTGITVITVDSTVESNAHLSAVATNNLEAADDLTNYLAKELGEQGEVIMLNFVQGTSTAIQRERGYARSISKYPNIIKHETVYTEGTSLSAYQSTCNIMAQYPNISGIIGANQYMTEGIYQAIEEKGLRGKVKIVGFDNSPEIIEGIEKDGIEAIIAQKPFNMGYLGVKNAIKVFQNRPIPHFIDTGYKLITKEILYTTENQKLLYPIIQ